MHSFMSYVRFKSATIRDNNANTFSWNALMPITPTGTVRRCDSLAMCERQTMTVCERQEQGGGDGVREPNGERKREKRNFQASVGHCCQAAV